MSEDTVKIPKFRKTLRVGDWMDKHEHYERLPKEIEQVFFKTKEGYAERVQGLVGYLLHIEGDKPEELENLLYECAVKAIEMEEEQNRNSNAYYILDYCTKRYQYSGVIEDRFVDLLKGASHQLFSWARTIQKRLPAHLEDSIDDPSVLLCYATEIVRGRLPSHLEQVFFKNVHVATRYAFDVIRGFAPVKLPDDLHTFVVMESYRNPNDYHIKTYIQASENDPNKSGNIGEL